MQNSTPFVYRPELKSEKVTDDLLKIIKPQLRAKTSCLRELVITLISHLSRKARHALYYRYEIDISGVTHDADIRAVENLVRSIEAAL